MSIIQCNNESALPGFIMSGPATSRLRGSTLHTVISTEDVAPPDGLAYLREAALREIVPTELYGDRNTGFWGKIAVGDLGVVTIERTATGSTARRGVSRGAELIRRSDPELYHVVFHERASTMLMCDQRQTRFRPGDICLGNSSVPYEAWWESGVGRYLALHIPRKLLPAAPAVTRDLFGARLSGRSGVGALLRSFATQTARDLSGYTPSDAIRVSTMLVDLTAALIAHEMETTDALPTESGRQVLYLQIQGFIQQRLGEPGLAPAMIAEAHHISVRTLHRLFEARGCTVMDWIRTRRLDRCRHDLADPALADRPIRAIAARWGFAVQPHFSRAFQSAYGMSPSEYRRFFFPRHGVLSQGRAPESD
ncbi:helix-turn-helix domain-containing protein [Sinosporangium siamense]|uniref:AraC family transcriptional regulator n=1 Tax=Sinosporangium siamense TaxID=1367973 RepID=A0A919RF13_9ACTN|nr:helix-turn-helix domain-containing protein [Sinosporangium siamense]GII92187.1 AraC family transcriptional regulator [Sinosporangium siamense]